MEPPSGYKLAGEALPELTPAVVARANRASAGGPAAAAPVAIYVQAPRRGPKSYGWYLANRQLVLALYKPDPAGPAAGGQRWLCVVSHTRFETDAGLAYHQWSANAMLAEPVGGFQAGDKLKDYLEAM